MRLTQTLIAAIREIVAAVAGGEASVRLFGSRLDAARRLDLRPFLAARTQEVAHAHP